MSTPEFVTFTGADDRTDVDRMVQIGLRYPIEWGVLFSPKRQGVDPRYPGGDALSRLWWASLRRSAHLCGEHARRIMEGRDAILPVDLFYCERIQVNHRDPRAPQASEFANGWGVGRCVLQCRDIEFPSDGAVDWLFDRSGGRGEIPNGWPIHPGGDRLVGYAGGISSANIDTVLKIIAGSLTGPHDRYWLDMESGVRTDDWFDLDKVEAVCRAVYGANR